MNLFDTNCPSFFAPNERAEFESFLADLPMGYLLCLHDGSIVGAFGITAEEKGPRTRLNWIITNAAWLALSILALSDAGLATWLLKQRKEMAARVAAKSEAAARKLPELL